jgi:hypothetical protein
MYSRLELEGSEECFMGADGKGAYEMSIQQNDIEEQEFLAVACIKVGNLLNAMINRIVVGRYLVVSHSATSTTATTPVIQCQLTTLAEACVCAVGVKNTLRILHAFPSPSSHLSQSFNIRQLLSVVQ